MTAAGGTRGGPPRAGPTSGRVLSRSEGLLVAVLLTLSAVAWWAAHRLATPDMRLGILTGAAPMDRAMGPTMGHFMAFALFLGTWLVMMAAMMLPSVTPVIVGAGRIAATRGARNRTAYGMIAGYLLVWGVIGVAAYGLFAGFQALLSAGDTTTARVGGLVLLAAGAFQVSPLKRVCLRHCRSPLAVLAHYGESMARGRVGPVQVGIRHGLYCVGCCWALMVILLAAGMMSLTWMAAVAAIVFAEKVHRRGQSLSRVLGVALLVLGAVVLTVPGVVPALA